jgi:3-deoxy-D-manno-octulosonic-acid transferase
VARAQSFVDERTAGNRPVSLRSNFRENGAEVLLLDTLGELSFVYGFAHAAYVGGALAGRGHNIIEPIAHGVGVAYGPNRGDFESAQRAAEEFEVGARLHSAEELAAFWRRALADESWRTQTAARCDALMQANRGALERVVDVLEREVEAAKT